MKTKHIKKYYLKYNWKNINYYIYIYVLKNYI